MLDKQQFYGLTINSKFHQSRLTEQCKTGLSEDRALLLKEELLYHELMSTAAAKWRFSTTPLVFLKDWIIIMYVPGVKLYTVTV